MAYPLIVSFCTESPDGYYIDSAHKLADDCERLDLEYDIELIEDRGGRIQNCLQKPAFMLRKLLMLEEPLLWVDADLRIFKVPPIELEDFDLGLVKNRMSIKLQWLAGVILLMPTEPTYDFLEAWCEAAQKARVGEPNAGDHSLMIRVLKGMRGHVMVRTYPSNYCDTNETPNPDCYIHAQAAASQRRVIARRRRLQAERDAALVAQ